MFHMPRNATSHQSTARTTTLGKLAAAAAVLALTALAATGCTADGSSTSGHAPAQHTAPQFTSAKAVAAAFKCKYFFAVDAEPGATKSGLCTYNGDGIAVSWFKSTKQVTHFRATTAYNLRESLVYGSDWTLECPSAATCAELDRLMMGTLVTPAP